MGVYTKTNWLARVGVKLNRFAKANETSAYVELTNAPESISQNGTEFTADRMNNIESGVYGAVGQLSKGTTYTISGEFLITCTAGITLSLPDGFEIGTRKRVRNTSGADVTLSFSGSDTLLSGNTSILVGAGGYIDLEKVSATEWMITAGAVKKSVSATATIVLDDTPEQVLESDTSTGNNTLTIPNPGFIGQKVFVYSTGSGLTYVKGSGTLAGSRRSGIWSGASDLGTPVSEGLKIELTAISLSEWKPTNEVTAEYASGNNQVTQKSDGSVHFGLYSGFIGSAVGTFLLTYPMTIVRDNFPIAGNVGNIDAGTYFTWANYTNTALTVAFSAPNINNRAVANVGGKY